MFASCLKSSLWLTSVARLLRKGYPLLRQHCFLLWSFEVSSPLRTSQLNLGISTRDPQQVRQLSPTSAKRPAPRRRSGAHPTRSAKPVAARVSASSAVRSQLTGAQEEGCWPERAHRRALGFIKLPGAIPLRWLLIWLGVTGEGAVLLFVSSAGDFQRVIFFCAS